jgi:alanyl-tRNA synthetase
MVERIERDVNERIWANLPVTTREMPYPDALALGALAFFSEKYGDRVRVVTMGESIELCGGTHVGSTGALGLFRLAGQAGVAAGVRRIEAITGPGAYAALGQVERRLVEAAGLLKAQPDHLAKRIDQLLNERARLEERLTEALKHGGGAPAKGAVEFEVSGVKVTVAETQAEDRNEVAAVADRFREGKTGAVLVLMGTAGRGAIHVAVTDDLVGRGKKAGELVNRIAAVSGGKGGGRPTFASASAGDIHRLGAAKDAVSRLVSEWLAA